MSKTIRWDDPAYSGRSKSLDESSSASDEQLPLANTAAILPAKPQSTVATNTSWRELTSRDGRKYYFNAVTQKTLWEMPAEYREYLEFSRGDGRSSSAALATAGDEAFWAVLRERQVTSKFSWEEALRATITHPNYKCIASLQDRKASFMRFCEAMRAVEEEEAKAHRAACIEAFKAALLTDARIDSRCSWHQIVDWYGQAQVFKAVDSSRDRLEAFEDVLAQLKQQEAAGLLARRNSNLTLISGVLQELKVVLDTETGTFPDWRQIKPLLIEKASNIPELAQLDSIELLKAFHDYLEVQFNEYERKRKLAREEHLRQEFKLRERFCYFLRRLAVEGKLTPLSSWPSLLHSHLKGVPEYEEFIGTYLYGSTPLDCFYDILHEQQQAYLRDRVIIAEFLKKQYGSARAEDLPARLRRITRFHDELSALELADSRSIDFAFEELFGSASSTDSVEPSREQIDAYKHFLKHLTPPITARDRWSTVKERLRGHEAYEVMTEELREAYFYKYLKWLDSRTSPDRGSRREGRSPDRGSREAKRSRTRSPEAKRYSSRDDHYDRYYRK